MDASTYDKRKALLASAVQKVRESIAHASPEMTVDVTLTLEEALILLSVPSMRRADFAHTPAGVPIWESTVKRLNMGADVQLSAYGLPPVHNGQGE